MAFVLDDDTIALWPMEEVDENVSSRASNCITLAPATDQTTVNALLNAIKADYALHRVSTSFHTAADTLNVISAADASLLANSLTLANELKSDLNLHFLGDIWWNFVANQQALVGLFYNFERTDTFTVSVRTRNTGNGTILSKYDSTLERGWRLFFSGGRITFRLENHDSAAFNRISVQSTATTFNDGLEHTITVSYSGSSTAAGVKIYVDSALIAMTTEANGDTLSATTVTSADLVIGGVSGAVGDLVGCIVSHVAIFTSELNATQVGELFSQAGPPNLFATATAPDPSSWWKFNSLDTTADNGIIDYGTGAHHATPKFGLGPIPTNVHSSVDTTNRILSPYATDLTTVTTLTNELREKYVTHTQNGDGGAYHLKTGNPYHIVRTRPMRLYMVGTPVIGDMPGIQGGPRQAMGLGADNCRWFNNRSSGVFRTLRITNYNAADIAAFNGTDWTIEFFVYLDRDPETFGQMVVFAAAGSGETQPTNFLLQLGLGFGTVARGINLFWEHTAGVNVNAFQRSGIGLTVKTWTHVAVRGRTVQGNRNLDFYYDGVLVDTLNGVYHALTDATNVVTSPDAAVTLASVQTLANELKADYNAHRQNTGGVWHSVSDTVNVITSPNATDQTTANNLLNELKADFNLHIANSGGAYHGSTDTQNLVVATADASSLATSITLANVLKSVYNSHVGDLGFKKADGGAVGVTQAAVGGNGTNGTNTVHGGIAYLRLSTVARTTLELAAAAADPATITFDGSTAFLAPFQEEPQCRDIGPSGYHALHDYLLRNGTEVANFPGLFGGLNPLDSSLSKRFASGLVNRMGGDLRQELAAAVRNLSEFTVEAFIQPLDSTAHFILEVGGTTNGGPLVDNELFGFFIAATTRTSQVTFESELDFNHALYGETAIIDAVNPGDLEKWYYLVCRKRQLGPLPYWRFFDTLLQYAEAAHHSDLSFERTSAFTLHAKVHHVTTATARTFISKGRLATALVTTVNASDQTTVNALLNDLKAKFNLHRVNYGGGDASATNVNIGITALRYERTQHFSVNARVKLVAGGSGSFVIIGSAQATSDHRGWSFYIHNDGKPHFKLINTHNTNDLDVVSATATVHDGNWHTVGAVYTGGSNTASVSLYVDGVSVATASVLNTLSATIVGTGALRLLAFGDAGTSFYSGLARDISVWDTDLTAGNMLTLHNSGVPFLDLTAVAFAANLDAWWYVNEEDSQATNGVVDRSGNLLHGTVAGGFVPGTIQGQWHQAPDFTNFVITAAATSLGTSIALANALKAAYNLHVASTTFHGVADSANTVTSANATDLPTTITLANEIKADINAHIINTGGNYHQVKDTAAGYELGIGTDNRIFFRLENETGGKIERRVTTVALNNGVLTGVTLRYLGTSLASGATIYTDGVAQTMTTVTDTLSSGTCVNDESLKVGSRYADRFMKDFMREVAVWNMALPDAQIVDINLSPSANEGRPPPDLAVVATPTRLKGYWKFDDSDVSSIADHSGNSHPLTPRGGLTTVDIDCSQFEIFKNGQLFDTLGPVRNSQGGDVYAATNNEIYFYLTGSSEQQRRGSTKLSARLLTDEEIADNYSLYAETPVRFHTYYQMQAEDDNASGGAGEERPFYRSWVVIEEPDLDASEYNGAFFGMSMNFINIQVISEWVAQES